MSEIIWFGFSERGLSLVIITLSANFSAIEPIFGRLVVSLSPPQPNRQINFEPSGVISLAAFKTFSKPSGV